MIQYNPALPLSDFRNFLTLIWTHLLLPTPTRRQLSIAYYLQYGPRRKMVEAFRGVGKSWVTAAFVLFCLYNDPTMNILVVSASKSKADEFTSFCRRLIEDIPELQHMRPREGQRDVRDRFDVAGAPASQSPSLKSVGITGQITGSRADLIVPDDIETPNNSATQMMREKLAEAIKEFDAVLKPNGEVCYLGTPQTESSIYNLLPARGYEIKVWTARYPTETQRKNYGDTLAQDIIADIYRDPSLVGHSTEPTRFSDADLAQREMSYGRAGFNLQFMLDTRLSDLDRYPLKLRDLLVTDLDPKLAPERAMWSTSPEYMINDLQVVGMDGDKYYRPVPMPGITFLPYTGVVMSVDPSGRGKDETAWAVVAMANGLLYLLDAGGFSSGYEDATLTGLADVALKWGVNHIIVEANFGDGMFTKILTPVVAQVHPCKIEEVKHSKQKELRIIDTLEPVISSHRLVVNKALIMSDLNSTSARPGETALRYQLFYQLTRITREKGALTQDDRLDALSIAVAYWVEHMSRDTVKAVEQHREKLLIAELTKFKKNVFGVKQKEQRRGWVGRETVV